MGAGVLAFEGECDGLDGEPAPSGIASRALTARFRSTCSSCPGSARTRPARGASTVRSSTSSPSVRAQALEGRHTLLILEHYRAERLAATEGQELAREPAAWSAAPWIVARSWRRSCSGARVPQRELRGTLITVSRLLKSLRDAARESTDRLELLRLEELPLHARPVPRPHAAQSHPRRYRSTARRVPSGSRTGAARAAIQRYSPSFPQSRCSPS